jgi:hypothetical protein
MTASWSATGIAGDFNSIVEFGIIEFGVWLVGARSAVVALRFRRQRGGRSDYDVVDQRGRLRVIRQPSPWSLTATWDERLVDAISSLLPGK